MLEKISFVIPVYNAENTIERCINSILKQSYLNFEIILINDGSKDETQNICKKLDMKDSRIHFINKINEGVSKTRNLGIQMASGKYIWFVDADDELPEPDCLSIIIEQMSKHNTDLCVGGFWENTDQYVCKFQTENISIKNYILEMKKYYQNHYFSVLWNKVFRRDIIIQNKILFEESMHWGEDSKFLYEYMQYCNTINTINSAVYRYYNSELSLSKRKYSIQERWNINLKVFHSYQKVFIKNGLAGNENMYLLYTLKILSEEYIKEKQRLSYKDWKSVFYVEEIKSLFKYCDSDWSSYTKLCYLFIRCHMYYLLYALICFSCRR